MPLVPVSLRGADLAEGAQTRRDLAQAIRRLAPGQPVIVMIHGYKHDPFEDLNSPHHHILALDPRPCPKAISWPRALGVTGTGAEPLAIALGWPARGSLWQAYRRAATAGRGLAEIIAMIHRVRPGTEVQLIGHSLGARVILTALTHVRPGEVAGAVILAGAELRAVAQAAWDSPGGRGAWVLNVTSGENAVFDRSLAWLLAPHQRGARGLGQGLGPTRPGWCDLRIDAPEHRAALARLGYAVPPGRGRPCHWSVYLRPGLFALYRDLVTGVLAPRRLASALPAPAARPWAGLPALPLPFVRREAS